MRLWLAPLASGAGFHKPTVGPLYESDPDRRSGQGGTLVSSPKDSVWASKHSSLSRIPAVVGLVAPPYGLPSTDPTTPATAGQRCCPPVPSPRGVSGSRWWSAHADNSRRSEFPLDPLLSRRDRPLRRPPRLRTEDLVVPVAIPASPNLSAPLGGSFP